MQLATAFAWLSQAGRIVPANCLPFFVNVPGPAVQNSFFFLSVLFPVFAEMKIDSRHPGKLNGIMNRRAQKRGDPGRL